MGNIDGLKLILICAGQTRQSAAYNLGRYLYLVGKSADRFGREVDRGNLTHRIASEKRWLNANRKNLVLDLKTGRYKLTGKEIKPPDNGGARKPPGPEVF